MRLCNSKHSLEDAVHFAVLLAGNFQRGRHDVHDQISNWQRFPPHTATGKSFDFKNKKRSKHYSITSRRLDRKKIKPVENLERE